MKALQHLYLYEWVIITLVLKTNDGSFEKSFSDQKKRTISSEIFRVFWTKDPIMLSFYGIIDTNELKLMH